MLQIMVSGLLILNFSVVTELKNLSVGDYLMNVKIIGEEESQYWWCINRQGYSWIILYFLSSMSVITLKFLNLWRYWFQINTNTEHMQTMNAQRFLMNIINKKYFCCFHSFASCGLYKCSLRILNEHENRSQSVFLAL